MDVTLDAPPLAGQPTERLAAPVTRVVVQQRQRLFREGISQLLNAEVDLEVVAMATTDADLLAACREHRPAVVVMEAGISVWGPLRLVAGMRQALPRLTVIGLTGVPPTSHEVAKVRDTGMSAVVSHDTGIGGMLAALRSSTNPSARDRPPSVSRTAPSPASPRIMLTGRELEILSLVAAGLTSTAVGNRLHISHRTVENHKQRIFVKLGVKNQAHAVSTAIRSGLMRPDRLIDPAVGD